MEETRMKMQLEHNKCLEEERKKIKEREQQKRLEKIQKYERFHKPGPFYSENQLGGASFQREAARNTRELKPSADPIQNTRNNFQERHDRLLQQESLKIKQRNNLKRAEKIAKFEKLNSFKNIPAENIQTPSSIKSGADAENKKKNYEEEIRLARLKMQERHDMLVKQERLNLNSNEDNLQ